MLQITVNATSANVCVGFDVLGLALELNNIFLFKETKEFDFIGFDREFRFDNNLVYTSYLNVFKKAGKSPIPVTISFKGDIPMSRGLGSSSSLIVAGVFAANYYLGGIYSKEELLDICASIEGHPDNVAPAIYGGLVASYKDRNDSYKSINYSVSDKLKFIVIIPTENVSTKNAREVLPKVLDYPSIVSNLGRIVNIPYAFKEGNLDLLYDLFVDKLHEPYRSKLIESYSNVKDIVDKYRLPFAISGSGSTMLIISKDDLILNDLKKYNAQLLEVGKGVKMEEIKDE